MKICQKRVGWMVFMLLVVIVGAGVVVWKFGVQRDALWQIVSHQCVPQQLQHNQPTPCVRVALDPGYVVFKDRRGSLHDLLMPIEPISGLESARLQDPQSLDFMGLAWQNRLRLSEMAAQPIPDTWVVLAINSQHGRSQDHLHVHIACMKAEVQQRLHQLTSQIGNEWTPLSEPLEGQRYWARRYQPDLLPQHTPIALLNQVLMHQGRKPGAFGLAMVQLPDGDFVLLATGMNLWRLDLGSTERLQDFECRMNLVG